ncbi:MAG: PQQ-binding-like beta-propeller repeat protein [Candidatus Woesearchaeota archaeon]
MKKIIYAFKRLLGGRVGNLNEKWKFDTKSVILTTPIVAGVNENSQTEILFGTKEGKVFSLDENSNVKWIFDSKEKSDEVELMFLDNDYMNSIKSTPNVDDVDNDGNKEIIFGSEIGNMYCLDNNGKVKWKFETKSPIRGSPLIKDLIGNNQKEIIFGTLDGKIYILSCKGKEVTHFNVGQGIETMPLFVENKLIFGTNEGEIRAYNLKGELFWTYKTNNKISADVIVTDICKMNKYCLIVGSQDGNLYNLSLDGELNWMFKTNGSIMSKVAIGDINNDGKEEIVFGSCDNNIYCLKYNGDKLWSYETDFWVVSTPILKDIDKDGHIEIIAGSYDHNLYVLDNQGTYMLNYIPGLSGIVNQTGNYSSTNNLEVGDVVGKKLWQFKTDDMIVGCAIIDEKNEVIVNTKSGKISNLKLHD